jgi:hypothetical protein
MACFKRGGVNDWARPRSICQNWIQLLGTSPYGPPSQLACPPPFEAPSPSCFGVVCAGLGSLLGPLWAGGNQQALRLVPGPSPRQTIDNFLATTEQAHVLIHGAIREGLANPG